jgi:hypothetical protein
MQDTECGDDIRAGAVKILEVLLTQCQGRLDNYIGDIIVLLMQYFAQSQENFEEFETQVAVVRNFVIVLLSFVLLKILDFGFGIRLQPSTILDDYCPH